MFVHGRADLGVWAALKALPVAAALAAAAKLIVDRGLQKRWVHAWLLTRTQGCRLFACPAASSA